MVHEITCRDEHVTNRRPGKKTLHPFHWAKFAFGRKLISPKKAFDQKLLAAKLQAKNIIRYDFVKLSRAGRKTPIGLSKFFWQKKHRTLDDFHHIFVPKLLSKNFFKVL